MIKRCAVYTRKSTEEGLEQAFNSLDAQRDACSAFIASQRQEGWTELAQHYDDGGYSGGNMQRPGLNLLLADIANGKVDVVVVYKIDRLTRSLSDFARIIDVFDEAGTAFVSVTQAFNSGNSMGRLMLHVLLSFAQFEREVTAERIRDKIAASKARGMWMGGNPPFGYDVAERRLVENAVEAATVRQIMQTYLTIGSVSGLLAWMQEQKIVTKRRIRLEKPIGGNAFAYGAVRHLLGNRTYVGEVVYKGTCYAGEHCAIVDRELFDQVQTMLAHAAERTDAPRRAASVSLLSNLLFDHHGRPMGASHAVKNGQRYRYYITRPKQISAGDPSALRMSAGDLEQVVCERLAQNFEQARSLTIEAAYEASDFAAQLRSGSADQRRRLVIATIQRVLLKGGSIDIVLRDSGEVINAPLRRIRHGNDVQLVRGDVDDSVMVRDDQLVRLMSEAYAARRLALSSYTKSADELARSFGRSIARLKKLIRLSYLSPEIVEAIVKGEHPETLRSVRFQHITNIPIAWDQQKAMLLR